MITQKHIDAIVAVNGHYKPDSAAFKAAVDHIINGTRISAAAEAQGISKSTAHDSVTRIKTAHAIICKAYGLEE